MLVTIENGDVKTVYDVHIEYLRKPLTGLAAGKVSRGTPYETTAVVSKVDKIYYNGDGKVESVDSTILGFGSAKANTGKKTKEGKVINQEAFCKRTGRRLAIYRALQNAIDNGHLSTVLTFEPKKVRTIEAFFEQLGKVMKI